MCAHDEVEAGARAALIAVEGAIAIPVVPSEAVGAAADGTGAVSVTQILPADAERCQDDEPLAARCRAGAAACPCCSAGPRLKRGSTMKQFPTSHLGSGHCFAHDDCKCRFSLDFAFNEDITCGGDSINFG